ncbi:hypothetical protein J5V83_003777 [Escherichia coli]|nr:hypothetical protein [Escherichia coli]
MNQTLPTADLNTAGTTDVIPSVAIDRIIAQRNEGIALFMQAMECLATARKILLDASGVNATMFDRYLPFSCPLRYFRY